MSHVLEGNHVVQILAQAQTSSDGYGTARFSISGPSLIEEKGTSTLNYDIQAQDLCEEHLTVSRFFDGASVRPKDAACSNWISGMLCAIQDKEDPLCQLLYQSQ